MFEPLMLMRTVRRLGVLLAPAFLFHPALAAAETLPPVTDPTQPPYAGAARAAGHGALKWRLESTRVSADKRSAVINGRVVTIGSRVAGALVTSIEPGRVRLRGDSTTYVLTLLLPAVKSTAQDSS